MTKCCGQESYENGRPQGDRRLRLIDDIKRIIGDIDSEERSRARGSGKKRGGVDIPGVPDMEQECLQYRKRRECSPPTITSISVHETRPTSMYDTMKYESSKRLTYVDATRSSDPWDPMPPAPWELPRTPSQELRAGTLYTSCDCRKRNGLQHDCQRWDCGGRPTCVAVNPGPCCEPSKARKPVRGDRRHGGAQVYPDSQTIPSKSVADGFPPGAKGPAAGAKDPPTLVCECAPVTPTASPLKTPQPLRLECSGVIAQAPDTCSTLTPGQGQCCQTVRETACRPPAQQPRPGPPTTGEFVAISSTGAKFLCCPMPS